MIFETYADPNIHCRFPQETAGCPDSFTFRLSHPFHFLTRIILKALTFLHYLDNSKSDLSHLFSNFFAACGFVLKALTFLHYLDSIKYDLSHFFFNFFYLTESSVYYIIRLRQITFFIV